MAAILSRPQCVKFSSDNWTVPQHWCNSPIQSYTSLILSPGEGHSLETQVFVPGEKLPAAYGWGDPEACVPTGRGQALQQEWREKNYIPTNWIIYHYNSAAWMVRYWLKTLRSSRKWLLIYKCQRGFADVFSCKEHPFSFKHVKEASWAYLTMSVSICAMKHNMQFINITFF